MTVLGTGFQQELILLEDNVRVHPTAQIAPGVELGRGTVVWAFAVILSGVRTGQHCSIGAGTQIMRDVTMGDSCRIGPMVFIPARARLGHRVFVGPAAAFTDDRRPRVNNPTYKAEPPIIGDDVAVGLGAILCPGVTLGEGSLIGAGAIVTRNVPRYNTVMGNPARQRVLVEVGTLEGL